MNKLDATDYESALLFSGNRLVLELLNNYCLCDVILNNFELLPNFAAVIATVIQIRIMLRHEHISFKVHLQTGTPKAHAAGACDVARDHIWYKSQSPI